VLRQVSDPVPPECIKSDEMKFLIKCMRDNLERYQLVGLAAPQIGISLRVFIISFGEHLKKKYTPEIYAAREMTTMPLTVLINPEIKVIDHRRVTFEEGCASILGFVGEVARSYEVEVTALNENGEQKVHKLKGWNARIAQHENDHLNGLLFTDVMNVKSFRCSEWEKINKNAGRIELRYCPK